VRDASCIYSHPTPLGVSSWCVTCLTSPHGLLLMVWMRQKKKIRKKAAMQTQTGKKERWKREGEKRKGKTLLTLLYDHKICMYDIGISICSVGSYYMYYTTTHNHNHPCRDAADGQMRGPGGLLASKGLGTGDAPQRGSESDDRQQLQRIIRSCCWAS
jgi:hypothetical protein